MGPETIGKAAVAMKTRTGGVVASIICALALAVGLSACGGGSGSGGDPAANFTGVWQLESMDGEDGITAEDLEMMAEMDLYVTMTLAEDGAVVLDFMGETTSGTWKAKNDTTADLTIDGETVEAKLDGGKIKMSQDGTTLIFIKSDLPASSASAGSDAPESDGEEEVVVEEVVEEEVITSGDVINVEYGVPFGDDLVSITVIDSGLDWGDDPGYNLKIENLSDQVLQVSYKYGTFSVGGKMVDPGMTQTVQPGKYAETFMWFASDDVPDVAALVDVEGTLEVTTEDWDTLSEIKVAFPNGQ